MAPPVVKVKYGPWKGMRQTVATASDRRDYADTMLNVYVRDPDITPVATGRPGFSMLGAGGTPQLGGVGARTGQLIHHFTKSDGTEYRIAIVGGKFYTYNTGTDAFTESLSAANLSAASVTLSATARVHAVDFDDTVVISDGVNTPWTWNGTGGGGITKLTNAPVFYGQPWVYGARLFGIKGTSTATRVSVVWSEVGAANTGYEAGGYLNIWDVTQTDSGIFYAGAGTNDAMILARANSTTRITGQVSDQFTSSSTREGVHERIGTLSPSGMLVYQDTVYYLANDGRVMKVQPGDRAEEIAPGAREAMARFNPGKFGLAEGLVWDTGAYGEYLCWSVANSATNSTDFVLVVDPRTDELVGVWQGWIQQRWGNWKDGDGQFRPTFVSGTTNVSAIDGYVYQLGTPVGTVWSDGFQAASVAISHGITTHAGAFDEVTEKYWDIIQASVLLPSDYTGVSINVVTPYGPSVAQTTMSVQGGGSRFGTAVLGTATFGVPSLEQQIAVGADTVGRWAAVSLQHDSLGEQFECQSIAARAQTSGDAPDIL